MLNEMIKWRVEQDRKEGKLEERIVTVVKIEKGKHFYDSEEPTYEITSHYGGTAIFFEKDLDPKIEKIKPGDKLIYKTSCWSIIAEIRDMDGNVLYKR